MKSAVARFLSEALDALPDLGDVIGTLEIESTVERTRDATHGNFASNLAMRLAKPARRSPRDLAAAIVEKLPDTDQIEKTEIAGPGFINFYLSATAFHAEIETIKNGVTGQQHADEQKPDQIQIHCQTSL